MSDTPRDRRYLATHEWHKAEGGIVTLGISRFAADELTDITFVDLPKVGTTVSANGRFGEIESVKATSDLYSGVGGTVVEVNESLREHPGTINTDPYEAGWMIRVKTDGTGDSDQLLAAEQYLKVVGQS